MTINTNNLVSITETNQNFSKIARLVDKTGTAIILKNNIPRYIILEYSQLKGEETAENDEVLDVARKYIKKHLAAFKELAK
ncbi:prevent-host-death protein [Spirochaetia bacterium]|nr:prevent-host-death protein [Spirochaetia bacterium]